MNNVMAKYKEYANRQGSKALKKHLCQGNPQANKKGSFSKILNPNSPLQKLQYDMGEDRWLCTLMLMQGGRIEYEAGSHCFTFAPEELDEFYKPRFQSNFS